jgi:hypothetical protein
MADLDARPAGDGAPDSGGKSDRSAAPPPLSVWHRPISYRVQCWIAWAGLTAFGVRGLLATLRGDGTDVERVSALGLSVAWGIDLLRDRSSER